MAPDLDSGSIVPLGREGGVRLRPIRLGLECRLERHRVAGRKPRGSVESDWKCVSRRLAVYRSVRLDWRWRGREQGEELGSYCIFPKDRQP